MISGAPVAFQPCSGRFSWRQRYQSRVNFALRASLPHATIFKSSLDASAGGAVVGTMRSDVLLLSAGPEV